MSLYEIGQRLRGKRKRKSWFNVRAAVFTAVLVFLGIFSLWFGLEQGLYESHRRKLDYPPDYPDFDTDLALRRSMIYGVIVAVVAGIFIGLVW